MRRTVLGHDLTWRTGFDAAAGVAMLALAFVGIGASDVSGVGSQTYWSLLAVGFGVASYAMQWVHRDGRTHSTSEAVRTAAHWIGVLAGVQIVYLFIATGRMANADDGLVNGVVLGLGAVLFGVHVNWRLAVIGVAIGMATIAVAFMEQYLWALFGLALVAIAVLALVSRARGSGAAA